MVGLQQVVPSSVQDAVTSQEVKDEQQRAVTHKKKVLAHQGRNDWWTKFLEDDNLSPEECQKQVEAAVVADSELLNHRDVTGAYLIHWVALISGDTPGRPQRAKALLDWFVSKENSALFGGEEKHIEMLNSVYDPREAAREIADDAEEIGYFRGFYDGEGLLHILIIRRDFETLEKVLEFKTIRFDIRAHGTFFDAKTALYYGEYPISFAAAIGWIDGLELMKEYIDREYEGTKDKSFRDFVELEDSCGNAALHLSVLRKQLKAYTWLRKQGKADNGHRNTIGYTPVTLACVVNDFKVFEHVLDDMCVIKWTYGPVTCFRFPLPQVESVIIPDQKQGADQQKSSDDGQTSQMMGDTSLVSPFTVSKSFLSAIEVILLQSCEQVVVNGIILEILSLKWKKYARYVYYLQGFVQATYLSILSILVYVFHNDQAAGSNYLGYSLQTLEIVVFAYTSVCYVGTALDIIAGWRALTKKMRILQAERHQLERPSDAITESECNKMTMPRSAAKMTKSVTGRPVGVYNIMPISIYDTLALFGQFCISFHFILHQLDVWPQWSRVLLSLGVMLMWQSSMSLLVASRHFGTLVIIVIRVLQKDIPSFVFFMLISCAGFSQGVLLLNPPASNADDLSNPLYGVLTMFRVMLGEKPSWTKFAGMDAMESPTGIFAGVYYFAFSATTTIVLLRLMISMFNETYGGVKKKAEEEWRLIWGQMILRIERRLKLILPRRYHHRLGTDDPEEEGCSYVFQRVNSKMFDGVPGDGMLGARGYARGKGVTPAQAAMNPEMQAFLTMMMSTLETQGKTIKEQGRMLERQSLELRKVSALMERDRSVHRHDAIMELTSVQG